MNVLPNGLPQQWPARRDGQPGRPAAPEPGAAIQSRGYGGLAGSAEGLPSKPAPRPARALPFMAVNAYRAAHGAVQAARPDDPARPQDRKPR